MLDKLLGSNLLVILAFVLGAALAWYVQGLHIAAMKEWHASYVAQVEKSAAQLELKWQKEKENAEREAQVRLEKSEAERAALAVAADRLRRDAASLRTRLADAPGPACVDAAAAAGELLAECGAAYRDLALAAQRHADDLRTFQAAWPGAGVSP
jgi:hypothetical protein